MLDSRPGTGEALLDVLGRQAEDFHQLDRAAAAVAKGGVVNELRRLTAREHVLQRHVLDRERTARRRVGRPGDSRSPRCRRRRTRNGAARRAAVGTDPPARSLLSVAVSLRVDRRPHPPGASLHLFLPRRTPGKSSRCQWRIPAARARGGRPDVAGDHGHTGQQRRRGQQRLLDGDACDVGEHVRVCGRTCRASRPRCRAGSAASPRGSPPTPPGGRMG